MKELEKEFKQNPEEDKNELAAWLEMIRGLKNAVKSLDDNAMKFSDAIYDESNDTRTQVNDLDLANPAQYENDEYFNFEESLPGGNGCKCLPACSSIHYDTEISQSSFKTSNKVEENGDKLESLIWF